jgi:hypothetical protein
MNHSQKSKIIQFIRPNAEFVLRDNVIEWLDKVQIEPTNKELEDGLIAYEAKMEADKIEALTKKAAAEAKLAALGLTSDDLKALGLG